MKRLLSSLFIIAGIAILVVAVAAWGKSPGKHIEAARRSR